MDKKLIKLLAILVGLILLLVVFMLLVNGAKNNKKYTFDEVSKEAVSAAKKYLSSNSSRKPDSMNPKTIIPLSTLVDENYMKEPSELLKDDDASCFGDVEVYYLENKKYDYIPNINCTIEGEKWFAKNLVNTLIGDGEVNITLSGSGLYKRVNGKWITNEDDLSSGSSEDTIEYYYRGDQNSSINNFVQIDNMVFRVVMIDNDSDLLLIYNENVQKGAPWDQRYNEDVRKTQGINIYENMGVKSFALEKIESFIAGEEKLENKTKFSSSLKYIVKEMDLCVGRRKMSDTGTDGTIECATVLSNQKAGLLPAYMYMSASIDPSCEKLEDRACGNSNYLAKFGNTYWLVTTNEELSNECYSVNKSVSSGVCSGNNSYKPIIKVTGRVQFKEGTGTSNDPYILDTTYYNTDTNKKKN